MVALWNLDFWSRGRLVWNVSTDRLYGSLGKIGADSECDGCDRGEKIG